MSALVAEWVPVSSLYTGAQIVWYGQEWIVQEVLPYPAPLSGWIVIAVAVNDYTSPPVRVPLSYGNQSAQAQLVHRVLEASHAT